MAVETAAGAASCSARNAAWISTARSSTRRWRPPRRSAAAILARDRVRPSSGVGRDPQHLERVGAGQVVERDQGGRVELAQGGAQHVGLTAPGPDHGLMGPGQHLDRLDRRRCRRRPGGGCGGRCGPCRPAPWRRRDRTSPPRSSGGPGSATSTSGSPRTPGSRPPPARRRTGPGRSRCRSPPRPGSSTWPPTRSWKRAMPSTPSGSRPPPRRLPVLVCTHDVVVGLSPVHPYKDHPSPPARRPAPSPSPRTPAAT